MLSFMTPVSDSDIPTYREWIRHAPYSAARKAYFDALLNTIDRIVKRDTGNESFIKRETYPEQKAPRAINSYTDVIKAMLGPTIKALDKATFRYGNAHGCFFVKGTCNSEWPHMLDQLLGGKPCVSSDFTAFESHHEGLFSHAVRKWVTHMLSPTHSRNEMHLILRLMSQINECSFSKISASVPERLMSGALWTSSSNGFLNLMIMSYFTKVARGCTTEEVYTDLRGRVEGDDGIFEDCGVSNVDPSILGCVMDLTPHATVREADFCSMITVENSVLTDPIRFMQKFFVMPVALLNSNQGLQDDYLVGKARSYRHTFPGCPVVIPIVEAIIGRYPNAAPLRALQYLDQYERETLIRALTTTDGIDRRAAIDAIGQRSATARRRMFKPVEPTTITMEARILMQQRYGVEISTQHMFERSVIHRAPMSCDEHITPAMYAHSIAHYHYLDKGAALPQNPTAHYLPDAVQQCLRDRGLGLDIRRPDVEPFTMAVDDATLRC
jgi:hypothetical protein